MMGKTDSPQQIAGCPDREQLAKFALGAHTPLVVEQIVAHLDSCDKCQTLLATLENESDHLVVELGQIGERDPPPDEEGYRRVVDFSPATRRRDDQ